jgi:hypothetical protein
MIERLASGGYRVRWYEAGRRGRHRSRTFRREKDANLFEAEIVRRKALGDLALLDASNCTVDEAGSGVVATVRGAESRGSHA